MFHNDRVQAGVSYNLWLQSLLSQNERCHWLEQIYTYHNNIIGVSEDPALHRHADSQTSWQIIVYGIPIIIYIKKFKLYDRFNPT